MKKGQAQQLVPAASAAIARTHGLTLVSAGQEFNRVPGLSFEDWT